MKLTILLIFFLSIYGCASVTTLGSVKYPEIKNCTVTVYSSKQSAETKGPIEEVCIISGTSSMSFSHTVSSAIEKNKHKACDCGATNVYIQDQDAGTLGTASVTLVGFRFTDEEK